MVHVGSLYSSIILNLNISSCRNLGETQLVNIVKANLITGFKSFWQQLRGGEGEFLMESLIHIVM